MAADNTSMENTRAFAKRRRVRFIRPVRMPLRDHLMYHLFSEVFAMEDRVSYPINSVHFW